MELLREIREAKNLSPDGAALPGAIAVIIAFPVLPTQFKRGRCSMDWLRTHEFLAIWLAGIALILIFVWDRLDSRKQHRETLAQSSISQKQVEASQNNAAAAKAGAEYIIHTERAWVMAELGWSEKSILHVEQSASKSEAEGTVERVTANVKLTCKNEGRSPAWVDKVYGHLEILPAGSMLGSPNRSAGQNFGPIGPLGVGKEQSRSLDLTCLGCLKRGEFLSAYIAIEYHDIYGFKRETFLGYKIDPWSGGIDRQDDSPERNRNT